MDNTRYDDADFFNEPHRGGVGEEAISQAKKAERFLRSEDYSLDSPILLDDLITGYMSRSKDKLPRGIATKNLTKLFKKVENPVHPTFSHRALFEWLTGKFNLFKNTKNFLTELKESMIYLKECFSVPHTTRTIMLSFFSSISPVATDGDLNWKRFEARLDDLFSDPRNPIIIYWHIYQLVRSCVLIMNSVNQEEINSVISTYSDIRPSLSVTTIEGGKEFSLGVKDLSLGDFILNKNGILIVEKSLVLDKNMLLMLQDLLSSRFCTLITLLYPDSRYSSALFTTVQSLYIMGDELIAKVGNPGYDVIKLIEPICNHRIKTISERNPMIISDTSFGNYLSSEVSKLNQIHGHLSERFFETLNADENHYNMVFIFGLFRHWGHPYIEYMEGLDKLYQNVQCKKEIDQGYVKVLASDLARRIIKHFFRLNKSWPVLLDDIAPEHPFYKHIKDSTWPNRSEERSFGDHWDSIPFQKVFDAPTSVNLSEILDDKSHSLDFTRLKEAISEGSVGSANQRKVLLSALKRNEINVPEFLQSIDSNGFEKDDLVIGLRAKERELKRIGRFFALMTFNLRLYFVITEMMIATHILPLFPSLTMTCSMNKVFKKMSECAPGHGTDYSDHLTYAEHFDYEKWNNHQRKESTEQVFRIIDRAFGFNYLISRTHDIFKQSFVYFANRPDLMTVRGDDIVNVDPTMRVCWSGQDGGLEGLRQKGWSLISLLMIERESRNRNPRVRTLAQGDNQVVCITYLIPSEQDIVLRKSNYLDAYRNRSHLLNCIYSGAAKLGLIIKPDESWSSYNYLIYGKFAMVGGNLVCSESKRYSRINIVSNDLIQNMSNTISSVTTTCLTVCQQSDSITKPIHLFITFGSWVIKSILQYNLITFSTIRKRDQIRSMDKEISRLLFLDSSLGGLGGSSLLRFMIRQFPDPVTESLSFWKLIYNNTDDPTVKELALESACPDLKTFDLLDILKLIESPMSLNCKTGANASSILKNLIRDELTNSIHDIKHNTIKDCLIHVSNTRVHFLQYLNSITPKFPRFLSNFYAASVYGFIDSIIGLIQNSRTIRLLFTDKFTKSICARISNSELKDIEDMIVYRKRKRSCIWTCSSALADELRNASWGRVVGATVPHPAELVKLVDGYKCPRDHTKLNYLTCHYNIPVVLYPQYLKGPCTPYMGSETSDLTELYHAWEKRTECVLLRKALDLRSAIHWFINPGSSLHQALVRNLQSLTDESAQELMTPGPERAGSYVHRYSSPFQSAGGFSAICQNKLRYTLSTTDTMSGLADTNWDFMYQSVLLFGQTVVTCFQDLESFKGVIHGHVECENCLRPVSSEILDTNMMPPVFHSLTRSSSLFIPRERIPFITTQIRLEQLPKISSQEISSEISFQIGNTQGFLHTLSLCYDLKLDDMGSLFPKSVFDNLIPHKYFTGFIMGIIRATLINSLTHQFIFTKRDRVMNFKGILLSHVMRIKEAHDVASLISSERFSNYLSNISHISGSHYPLSSGEILDMLKTYLIAKIAKSFRFYVNMICRITRIVLFPETVTSFIASGLVVSVPLARGILINDKFGKKEILKYKHILHLTNVSLNSSPLNLLENLKMIPIPIVVCYEDMKTVSKKEIPSGVNYNKHISHYEEYEGVSRMLFLRSHTQCVNPESVIPQVPDRYSPLISGLRLIQIQTGAHYKLKCLFKHLSITPNYIICGGDYSGGFSSQLLRKFPRCILAFNSLLDLSKFPGGGMHPAPPSGISRLPEEMKVRCINLHSVWEESSDLTEQATWDTLIGHFPRNSVDLVVIDAETKSVESSTKIAKLLELNLTRLHNNVHVIYKCYYSLLRDRGYQVLSILSSCFEQIEAITTEFSGSFSSEFYVLCSRIRRVSQSRYVDESSLLGLRKIIHCLSSYQSELSRALAINNKNTCKGLTEHFWVGGDVVLLGLLTGMGIAPVLGQRIEASVKSAGCFSEFFGAVVFSFSYLIKELNVKVDSSYRIEDNIPIPSADWCESFGCMIYGFMNLLAFYMRSAELYAITTEATNYVVFYDVDRRGNIVWSFQDINRQSIRCRINRKKHLGATWIRIFELWRYELGYDITQIDFHKMNTIATHCLKMMQFERYNKRFLLNNTGFINLMEVAMGDLSQYIFEHKCVDCPRPKGFGSEEKSFEDQELTGGSFN